MLSRAAEGGLGTGVALVPLGFATDVLMVWVRFSTRAPWVFNGHLGDSGNNGAGGNVSGRDKGALTASSSASACERAR